MKCTSISLTEGLMCFFFFFSRISYYFQKFLEGLKKKKRKKMCAGLRLGCKDSSGSNDYFLLSLKKKNPTTTGIIPLCRVHPTVFKAEVVRHQTVQTVILQGWVCKSPPSTCGQWVSWSVLQTPFQEASRGIICFKG